MHKHVISKFYTRELRSVESCVKLKDKMYDIIDMQESIRWSQVRIIV